MTIRSASRVLFIAYFLEVGLLLIVVPWSTYWTQNFFAESVPGLRPLIMNNFVRGAVSGLGAITVWAGLADLATLMAGRRRAASGPEQARH